MTSEISNIRIIAISALLHDIGKLVQRTGIEKPPIENSTEYANFAKSSPDKMRYGYIHSIFTHDFIDEFRSIFEPQKIYIGEQKEMNNIAWLAAKHHNPSNRFHKLIQKSDRLSAGFDRESNPEYHKKGDYKTVRLTSIFENLRLDSAGTPSHEYDYELRGLSFIDDRVFPSKSSKHDKSDSEQEYKVLLEALKKDIKKFDIHSPFAVSSLASMLEKYTWCIPSSTIDIPDISLYCHSLTTAAFATSLYRYFEETNPEFSEDEIENNDEKRFLFISGDISGIQKYIFSLKRENLRGVSKVLRARSFYIDKLVDALSLVIVSKLGLPLINRIIHAGGRFLILAHNTPDTIEKLKTIRKEINTWLYREFMGEICFNIDFSVSSSADDLSTQKFSEIQEKIGKSIELEKLRPFRDILSTKDFNPMDMVFSDQYELLKKNSPCSMCNKNPISDEYLDDQLCKSCYNQKEKIGKNLPYARYLVWHDESLPESIRFFDGDLGISLSLAKSRNETEDIKNPILIENIDPYREKHLFPQRHIANYIPRFSDQANKCSTLSQTYRKESEDECPERPAPNSIKTFTCIACSSLDILDGKPIGRPMLGVLKADVDNLGKLFSTGLENYALGLSGRGYSLSHYITLSSLLNNFFTGVLQSLVSGNYKNKEQYRDIYTVYSGGDDLLYIGPYDIIINFAEEMNNLFREYTCNNSHITLSAGVNVIHSSMPIYNAVSKADSMLEDSKKLTENDKIIKNALTLFSTTIQWHDIRPLLEYKDRLNSLIRDPDSNTSDSFFYRILLYHNMFLSMIKDNRDMHNLRYKPLFTYDLYRNIAKRDSSEKIINQDEIDTFRELLKDPIEENKLMKYLKIPMFLTVYKNRNIEKIKKS